MLRVLRFNTACLPSLLTKPLSLQPRDILDLGINVDKAVPASCP